jgi:hypothetical protein
MEYPDFMKTACLLCGALVSLALGAARADQIEMQNGDRYFGKVLAMTNSTLVVQSEILGTISVPREKVLHISLGAVSLTNSAFGSGLAGKPMLPSGKKPLVAAAPAPTPTGANALAATASQESSDQKQLIQQIQDEFLGGADPAAKAKYNEMVNGFLSGKVNLGDIRAQAKAAADQLRAARKDLGEDAGFALDGYLTILDSFLKETASTPATTPAPPAKPVPATAPEREEE